jgi:predicted nucleotidyltransferase
MIQSVLRKLIEDYQPQRVILFGSHAGGKPDADSDIDLLIIKETTARWIDRWTRTQEIVSDPQRRTPVETIVLTPREVASRVAAGDQFVAEILEKGQVLYAR